jgi:hypothetical protein
MEARVMLSGSIYSYGWRNDRSASLYIVFGHRDQSLYPDSHFRLSERLGVVKAYVYHEMQKDIIWKPKILLLENS